MHCFLRLKVKLVKVKQWTAFKTFYYFKTNKNPGPAQWMVTEYIKEEETEAKA